MPRNVEIKARVASLAVIHAKAAPLANAEPVLIDQDDTFFRCDNGRLKLRAFSDHAGELIFYRRADQAGPKESFYVRVPTSAPALLRESLSLAYGQAGRVRKRRTLFLVGRTRVHLDEVEGLGRFVELEVVLADDEPTRNGVDEARALMQALGIEQTQCVETAYVDLLAACAPKTSS